MSIARTPALNQATNTRRFAYIGGWFSLGECAPKRPPREQKLPLFSGTLKFDTLNGLDSKVTSVNQTICRVSRHSFAICSFTIITKSPVAPRAFFANSGSGMPRSGSVVCAPLLGCSSSLPTCG